MRIRQSIRKNSLRIIAMQLMLLGFLAVTLPPVHAAPAKDNQSKSQQQAAGKGNGNGKGNGQGNGNGDPTGTANQSEISSGGLPTSSANENNVNKILNIVLGIIGSFALLGITASGLKYITSAGNPQKTSEAKNGIVYSLVGLMVAIASGAIVAFVVHRT